MSRRKNPTTTATPPLRTPTLETAIADLLERLAKAEADGTLDIKMIPAMETEKRALEIAAAGGHRVAVEPLLYPDRLADDHPVPLNVVVKLHGYLVKAFERQAPGAVVVKGGADNPDIIVNTYVAGIDILIPPPTEIGTVTADYVAKTKKQNKPTELDHQALALLDEATRRLHLSDERRASVVAVASTISVLAWPFEPTPRITRVAVAEALSYMWADTTPPPAGVGGSQP